MTEISLSAISFGLLAAFSWGSGDFIGGFLTRKLSNFVVVFGVELFGIAALLISALVSGEPMASSRDLFISAVAGIIGMVGILTFYQGMAIFPIGQIVPLTAVLTAIVPVVFGIFIEGLPGIFSLAGLVAGVVAIWLISSEKASLNGLARGDRKLFGYAALAGFSFGLFFLVIAQVTEGSVFWPVVSARAASLVLIGGYLALRRDHITGLRSKLSAGILFIIFLGGLLDTAGNVFFILAAHAGRLDVSAVLASLYPAATVFLAWMILHERLTHRQLVGVATGVIAVMLISA